MTVAGFDTETHLIAPGLLAPPLVVGSYADDEGKTALLSPDEAVEVFRDLCRGDAVIAGANIPYDVGVLAAHEERRGGYPQELLELVFEKWGREGQVHDVLVCEALHAIAGGHLFRQPNGLPLRAPGSGKEVHRYSLDVVCGLVLGRETAKANDFWRKRYAILASVPRAEWPPDALQYPVDDAVNTRDVALAQRGIPEGCKPHRNLDGLGRETRADLCLHFGAMWGLRTNRPWLEALSARVDALAASHATTYSFLYKWGHEKGCAKKAAKAGHAEPATDGSDCVTTCDHGKENGRLKKRMTAEAYGASGVCPSCGGAGRRVGSKGNEVGCSTQYCKDGLPCCDTTGLDLSTAPALPRTDGGGVSASRDSLMESGDEQLMGYADDEWDKLKTTQIPFMRRGLDYPLTLSPNVLVSSMRMSYHGCVQQMSKDGEIRVCAEARPGWVYFSNDYSGVELCTLAQVCIWLVGFSRMAQIINETGDPGGLHAVFGAQMAGVGVDEFKRRVKAGDKSSKDFRQAAKAANFGFPGGMGPAKLVAAKRKKGEGLTIAPDGTKYTGIRFCVLLGGAESCGREKVTEWKGRACPPVCRACVMQAEILRRNWFDAFPEMPKYFEVVSKIAEGAAEIRLPFPGSTRGGVGFTDGANGHFQELAAILAKTALWRVKRECYVDTASPLYRTTRVPFVVHDEFFGETQIDTAHLAAPRCATIMVDAGADVVPDVRIACEAALSRRWLKAMEPAFSPDGRLIPWEDGTAGKKYLAEKGWVL